MQAIYVSVSIYRISPPDAFLRTSYGSIRIPREIPEYWIHVQLDPLSK